MFIDLATMAIVAIAIATPAILLSEDWVRRIYNPFFTDKGAVFAVLVTIFMFMVYGDNLEMGLTLYLGYIAGFMIVAYRLIMTQPVPLKRGGSLVSHQKYYIK